MQSRLIKENLLAVGIALVLSFVVFLAVQNSSLLTADIAGNQVTFSEESDLVSYVDGDNLVIAATKSFPQAVGVSMMVFYDPETVKIERDAIDSDYTVSYAAADPGRASLSLFGDFAAIQQGETLVSFDVLGDARDITVSDIIIEFADESTDRLSLAIK
ncbi:MAG: hypothetical protein H6765_03675 [Candidatus Peribacteria bacterium]|nr:MAG: hypothetical protein H6765_03675 [Candidatus Peribacteria bacterium]